MLNIRLSVLALTLVGLAVTMLSGCSSTSADPTAAWAPEKIYSEARDELSAGAWDRAAMLFDKLEGRAAGTPLAQQAQIEKAYAQYRATEKIQAIATLDRFLKLHPASPAVDYALYLKWLGQFQRQLGLVLFHHQARFVRARSKSRQGLF
jgi:outer membrane protein assembly factor BamD